MTAQPNDGRFVFADGIVWDHGLGQAVRHDKYAYIAGARVVAISVWTPMPRVLHIYLMPDQGYAWDWERKPTGGRFAR